MIKIIILVLISLIVFSPYIKIIKKNLKKIAALIFIIININLFTSKSIIVLKKDYLYGQSDFDAYASAAQQSMRQTGVYASLTLAQAAQEQNFKAPKCADGTNTNNFFGMKTGSSYTGPSCSLTTKEENSNGSTSTIQANFRVYGSESEGFAAHGEFLINSFGNRKVFNAATTLKDQLLSLKSNPSAMYATDSDYLCKLLDIINKYDLTKYDEGITYTGRGITIVGKHEPNLSIGNCKVTGGLFGGGVNYKTTYSGDIKQGWLYNRLYFRDYINITDADDIEDNMDEQINEIFERTINDYGGASGISGPGLSAADSTGFRQRLSAPTKNGDGSMYYFSSANASYAGGYLGQCTWYAYGRANEILSTVGSELKWNIASNAGLWYDQNNQKGAAGFQSSNVYTEPRVGAIISWKKAGAPGHVAVVEAINSDGTITISEANVSSAKSSSNPYGWQSVNLTLDEVKTRWSSYQLAGYIYILN